MLFRLANHNIRPIEVRRMAINCLGNISVGTGGKLNPWRKQIYDVLLSNLGSSPTSKRVLELSDPALRKVGFLFSFFLKPFLKFGSGIDSPSIYRSPAARSDRCNWF